MTHLQIIRDQKEDMVEEILDRFSPGCDDSIMLFTKGILVYITDDTADEFGIRYPYIIKHIEPDGNILCFFIDDVSEENVSTLYDLSIEDLSKIIDEIETGDYSFMTM